MTKKNLKIMLLINVAFILIYIALAYYYSTNDIGFGPVSILMEFSPAGIIGSVIDIILWIVMWFSDVKINKVVKTVSTIIGYCFLGLILGIVINFGIFMLALFAIFILAYSLIFQIIALAIEEKNYSYFGYILTVFFIGWILISSIFV